MSTESHRMSRPTGLPWSAADIGRLLWGIFFVGSGIVNLTVTLPHPEYYKSFADLTFFPFYRTLLLTIAVPNAYLITGLVILFEIAAGVMMLAKGTAVRLGLMGTILWLVFVCPAMGWYTLFSPLMIVIPALLLRYEYRHSIIDMVLKRRSG